jgi:hypothetical protein
MITFFFRVYNKVKGDSMKKIRIFFKGLGYNNHYQADVFIYDNTNLVFESKTYNGHVNVCLCPNKVYKIVARSLGETIMYHIYVINDKKYVLPFKRSIINHINNSITFRLTDYHYDNLPIERGEIILWPRM